MRILVTGANGLVGQALCSVIDQAGHQLTRAVRTSTTPWQVPVGDINEHTAWGAVLQAGVDVVVHLAAQVPAESPTVADQVGQFYTANTLGTANLARQCAQRGVKRFVFVSTAKVLGEGQDQPYRANDLAVPADAYATSKWEAEQVLWQIASETGMQVVVLRPPLVYGPGVKGNFLRLLQAVDGRRPLPLGCIQNKRSLVYVGNLVSAIDFCLSNPGAAGHTFMVSDGDDVSTPELVRRIATALGRRPWLLPVPVAWMCLAGALLGKQAAANRLLGSLAVDTTPLQTLGWQAPHTMQDGLAVTVQWYRTSKAGL